jgi:hypothetical protein
MQECYYLFRKRYVCIVRVEGGGGRSGFEPATRIPLDSQELGVRRIKRFLVLGRGLIGGALRVEAGVANGRPVILRLGESIGK